jgi:hypothetical protein
VHCSGEHGFEPLTSPLATASALLSLPASGARHVNAKSTRPRDDPVACSQFKRGGSGSSFHLETLLSFSAPGRTLSFWPSPPWLLSVYPKISGKWWLPLLPFFQPSSASAVKFVSGKHIRPRHGNRLLLVQFQRPACFLQAVSALPFQLHKTSQVPLNGSKETAKRSCNLSSTPQPAIQIQETA